MVQSLLDFQNLNQDHILKIIHQSLNIKNKVNQKYLDKPIRGTGALLFFEPSTRTRFSFQTACVRAGVVPLVLDSAGGSSLEKGESIEDTILNLEAMRPLFFVVRCPDYVQLEEITSQINVPLINAGWGKKSHPTQALLDVATLFEKWHELRGKNILFVGDVGHSRVFSSHKQLSKIMGYRLGYCAPAGFHEESLEKTEAIQVFDGMNEALEWADAVITLRVQRERHADKQTISGLTLDEYRKDYGLNSERAKILKPQALILHPGPINYGVEIEKEIVKDSRSVILQLVENGVFIREVVIQNVISGELK